MKLLVALLLAAAPLLWFYIKAAARKTNGLVQANLHLERMDEHLINYRHEAAKQEFDLLVLKSIKYPEITRYCESLPNNARNQRCLAFMKHITEQKEAAIRTPPFTQITHNDTIEQESEETHAKDARAASPKNKETDQIAIKFWEQFDTEYLQDGEAKATANLVERVHSALTAFVQSKDKQAFERFQMCLDIQAQQPSKPNRLKAHLTCHSEISRLYN